MEIRLGRSFPPVTRFFSLPIALFGLYILFIAPILGITIVAVCSFIWSTSYGFETNKFTEEFREYGSALGIKWGKWQKMDQFPDITILTLKEGYTVRSRLYLSTTVMESYYGIYLLTSSHRTKILVNKFKDLQKAKDFITPIALELNKEVVQYNPAISERTRMRRRNR